MKPGSPADRVSSEPLGFVHRFVPAVNPSNRVTLILLHGTGGDEHDLIRLGEAIAPGAALLSPRGNVLENGSPRFFRRIAEGRFDPAEIRPRAVELAQFIRAAVGKYALDPGELYAAGYSNGANIASTVMFLEPDLLKGSMLFRPMIVFEPDDDVDLSGHPVLIAAGRVDAVVPSDQPERLRDLFEKRHASVTLCWQVAGHNLAPADVREAAQWFQVHAGSAMANFSVRK